MRRWPTFFEYYFVLPSTVKPAAGLATISVNFAKATEWNWETR